MGPLHHAVAINLKRMRFERSWSIEVASAELGISPYAIAAIEAGRLALSLGSVEVLALRLGAEPPDLLSVEPTADGGR